MTELMARLQLRSRAASTERVCDDDSDDDWKQEDSVGPDLSGQEEEEDDDDEEMDYHYKCYTSDEEHPYPHAVDHDALTDID
jgi:hypothetical protein